MRKRNTPFELDLGDLPTIPAGWRWGRMEDAASSERNAIVDGPFGSNLKLSDYIDPPGVPVLTTKNLRGDYSPDTVRYISQNKYEELRRSEVRPGDILVAKIGSCGLTGRYPDEMPSAIIPANLLKMTVGTEFDPKFVLYYLNSPTFSRFLEKIITATAQPAFNVSKFRQLPFPLTDRNQQRRIVAEIEKQFTRLDAGVAALGRLQASLKRYRAAVLKAACEGDWPQKTLGEIAEVRLGKMLDKTKHVSGRKLPYLRNVNVRWGKIDTDDLREMYFEDTQLERFGLKAGDVLVCEGGEPGRAAIWKGDLPDMKYQKAIHRVRFNVPFEPRLLVWLLERLALTGGLERRFTGSTIKHFTREAFVELPIPVPPRAEQKRIVAEVERRMSVLEELDAVVSANLLRATCLRQSILQRAFAGRH